MKRSCKGFASSPVWKEKDFFFFSAGPDIIFIWVPKLFYEQTKKNLINPPLKMFSIYTTELDCSVQLWVWNYIIDFWINLFSKFSPIEICFVKFLNESFGKYSMVLWEISVNMYRSKMHIVVIDIEYLCVSTVVFYFCSNLIVI